MTEASAHVRVMVTGSHAFRDRPLLDKILDAVHARPGIALLMEGGRGGAELMAAEWAVRNKVTLLSGDFRRSTSLADEVARLIDEGKPDLLIAFAGGHATETIVQLARTSGVRLVEV